MDRKRLRDADVHEFLLRDRAFVAPVLMFSDAIRSTSHLGCLPTELRESPYLLHLLDLTTRADQLRPHEYVGYAVLFCDTLRKVVDRGDETLQDLRNLSTLDMLPKLAHYICSQGTLEG